MDTVFARLEEASKSGDVNSLKNLLKEDKLLLEKVIARIPPRDNPLHIVAVSGHVDFAREVISRKPELANQFDGQGWLPLHLAAAHGHVAVVQELLKAGSGLCLVRDRKEELLPLHVAIIKGRLFIVKELLEASEETIHELTIDGETVLHLAVKYNSLDVVEFLIDRVDCLNAKDNNGNTILHLAVANKQQSTIQILLSKPDIDVNSRNSMGLTPLDVLLESHPKHGDLVLGEIIRASGGETAAEVLLNSQALLNDSNYADNSKPNPQKRLNKSLCSNSREDLEKVPSEQEQTQNKRKSNPDILMVVATLVATITFQAALNPPGGFKDSINRDDEGSETEALRNRRLRSFLFFDILAMVSSVGVILLLLCVIPRKRIFAIRFLVWVVWLAAFAMAAAYTLAICITYELFQVEVEWVLRIMMIGWTAVLQVWFWWFAIQFIIFILKKGGLWKPVCWFFAFIKRKVLQPLCGTTTKCCGGPCRKMASVFSIFFVISVAYRLSLELFFYSSFPLY